MASWFVKRNSLRLVLLLCLTGGLLRAQSYHYFGARYCAHASVAAGNNNPFQPEGIKTPNWRAMAGLGKMVSEKFMIELNGGYIGNKYDVSLSDDGRYGAIVASANLKFFFHKRKGAVAPVGKYFFLEASYNRISMRYSEPRQLYQGNQLYLSYREITGSALLLSLGFGKNIVLHDRILLGVGTRLTVLPPRIFQLTPDQSSLAGGLRYRTWVANLLQAFFTAGYLF
jgi:hypothetical protein